jgi:hypothetical protein
MDADQRAEGRAELAQGLVVLPHQPHLRLHLWHQAHGTGEEQAQKNYADITPVIPDAARIQHEEDVHEEQLIEMLNEERLEYAGSVVLGLNDALVELTGALAGLTLALQNTKLIALSGLITGIAAAMSMAASEYLSTRSEDTENIPSARRSTRASPTSSRFPAHPALPAVRKLFLRPRHGRSHCRDHHRGLQLLHLRRKGEPSANGFWRWQA